MIKRQTDRDEILKRIKNYRVTAILGPRQSGKTTLAGSIPFNEYYDLENPRDMARLENPQLELEKKPGLIVIDEVQRRPNLFPLLRYLVDTNQNQK